MTEQSAAAIPQTGEKEALIARLTQGRDRYLHAFTGVSDNDADWRRAVGTWSILECAEHVAIAEEGMLRLWEKLARPGTSDPGKDAFVLATAQDRTQKRTAPERSHPTGRVATLTEALDRFRGERR